MAPASDLIETDEGYCLTMEIPGMSEEDVALKVDDGMLTLRGEDGISAQNFKLDWIFSAQELTLTSSLKGRRRHSNKTFVMKDKIFTRRKNELKINCKRRRPDSPRTSHPEQASYA